jgi:hypothetical protein
MAQIVATLRDDNLVATSVTNSPTCADDSFGLSGNDRIDGRSGDDRLFGGPGEENLLGSLGEGVLFDQDGDDLLFGGDGDDELLSAAAGDFLFGNGDSDLLLRGASNGLDGRTRRQPDRHGQCAGRRAWPEEWLPQPRRWRRPQSPTRRCLRQGQRPNQLHGGSENA